MKKILVVLSILGVALGVYVVVKLPKATKRMANIPDSSNKTSKAQPLQSIPAISVFAKNLEVPWAIVFLPGNSLLVTERRGQVRLIDKNGHLSEPLLVLSDVKQVGEGGLHGITIHPNFSENKYIYTYYTYSAKDNKSYNKVVRYKFDNEKFFDAKIIVRDIPGSVFHDGGRIKFGPDGFLYITTGDAQEPSLSQDRNSLAGKILRVNRDGDPAPGNPFGTLIYSYGHRNPQGLSWDERGRLWETEHGAQATDELNLIAAGQNYGWPTIRGDEKRTGMETPIINSGSETWAPAGAAYLEGSIFFGGLKGEALFEYRVKENKLVKYLKGKLGRIRDVVLGPDGMLYIATSNRDGRGVPGSEDDKIFRINPKKLSEL